MFFQRKRRASGVAAKPQIRRKLHTITGLLKERTFDGQFKAGTATYRFTFIPATAALTGGELELHGSFIVHAARGTVRRVEGVRAMLVGIQGGIGAPLARSPSRAISAGAGNLSTSEQIQEQAKAPELTPQPMPTHKAETDASSALPVAESTGAEAIVGVMYFRLPPLGANALGVPFDLSRVQLGVRIAPTDDIARNLQLLFSDLMAAIEARQVDEHAASEHVTEINRIFAG